MRKFHTKLTQKYQFYHNWHQHKYHNKAHWGVLAIYIFTIILYTVSGYGVAGNSFNYSNDIAISTITNLPVPDFNIPLTIQEALPQGIAGITRNFEPVTIGIPLSDNNNITDINQLGLVGANAGQFRAIARWPSGNIKWVLTDFQANVSAGETNSTISLVNGNGNFGGANLAIDKGVAIEVNTGAANFVLKKAKFNIFESVEIGGVKLVKENHEGKGIVIIDNLGQEFNSINDTNSTAEIEENGPVKTVVKAFGSLKDINGKRFIDYSLRIHFYKGKSYVKTFVTLKNASLKNVTVNPNYPKDYSISKVQFKSIELDLPILLSGNKGFEFSGKDNSFSGSFTSTEDAYVFQAFSSNNYGSDINQWSDVNAPINKIGTKKFDYALKGYEIKHGTDILHSLSNIDDDFVKGWGEIKNENGNGLTVAYRWMSSLWPSSIDFSGGGNVKVGIFSRHNTKTNIEFGWGVHETREIMFDFHTQPKNNDAVLYSLQYPLIARAPLDQYASSGAFFGKKNLVSKEAQENWMNKEIQKLSTQGMDSSTITNIQNSVKLTNLSPSIDRVFYWTWGPEFDIAVTQLYNFVRTGYGGFYLEGEQNTQFKADTAVIHSDDFDMSQNLSFDNEGVLANHNRDSMHNFRFDISHPHWISLSIAYFMTGNEMFKDATLEYGELMDKRNKTRYLNSLSKYMREQYMAMRDYTFEYEFTELVGDAKADTYKNSLVKMVSTLLDSRDQVSENSVLGRNLQRGYLHQYQDNHYLVDRVTSHFQLIQIHYEAVANAMEMLNTLGYPRMEELEDYLTGLARFIYEEEYVEVGSGLKLFEYGYPQYYYLDKANIINYNPDDIKSLGIRPLSSAKAMTYLYNKTGDKKYLEKAPKNFFGNVLWGEDEIASKFESQELMLIDTNKPVSFWENLELNSVENKGDGSYVLNWTAPQGAMKYQIKYSDKPIVEWLGFDQATRTYQYDPALYTAYFGSSNINNEPIPLLSGQTQIFSLSDLFCGDNCYFTIKYLSGGVSDTTPPTTPTNLTPTPISPSQINLSWTASTDDIGVTGYKIYRCAGSACSPTTQIATSTTNSYSNTGLTASTTYTYTVSAYDAAGNESAQSTSVSSATLPIYKQSDLNQDGKTDQLDFDILKQDYSRTDKPISDINQGGMVDSRDLGILMGEWGK